MQLLLLLCDTEITKQTTVDIGTARLSSTLPNWLTVATKCSVVSWTSLFTSCDCHIQSVHNIRSQIVASCHKLSQAVTNCHKLSQVITNCHKLSQVITNCNKLSQAKGIVGCAHLEPTWHDLLGQKSRLWAAFFLLRFNSGLFVLIWDFSDIHLLIVVPVLNVFSFWQNWLLFILTFLLRTVFFLLLALFGGRDDVLTDTDLVMMVMRMIIMRMRRRIRTYWGKPTVSYSRSNSFCILFP